MGCRHHVPFCPCRCPCCSVSHLLHVCLLSASRLWLDHHNSPLSANHLLLHPYDLRSVCLSYLAFVPLQSLLPASHQGLSPHNLLTACSLSAYCEVLTPTRLVVSSLLPVHPPPPSPHNSPPNASFTCMATCLEVLTACPPLSLSACPTYSLSTLTCIPQTDLPSVPPQQHLVCAPQWQALHGNFAAPMS